MKQAKQIDYNRDREFRNIERLKRLDNEIVGEIQGNLEEALIDIKRETNNWYLKYADDNGITVAEAQKVAESADIKELSSKAKQYVKWRHNQDFAFSEQANKEMREYNFSMRMSRQELLTKYMEIALSESFDKNDLAIGESLTKFGIDELTRQAGLLGLSVKDAEELKRDAEIIARSSFHGETFSERLWAQQEVLQDSLTKGITKSILVGKNPTTWMTSMGQCLTDIKKYGNYALRRLAVTEAGRVQIEVQRQSYVESGYEEYTIICEPAACPNCKVHDGKVYKVNDMEQGVNSPIFHPNCRCSTAPYVDRSEIDRLIEEKTYFEPAKSIKEAEEFARNNLGVPNVSYKGVDIATANAWNEGLKDSFERFPELKKNFGFVGEAHERNRMLKPAVKQYYMDRYAQGTTHISLEQLEPYADKATKSFMRSIQVGRDVPAVSYSPDEPNFLGFRGVSVNRYWGKDSTEFVKVLQENVQSKYHPTGCDTIRSILDHEIGHQLDNILEINKISEVQELFDSRTKRELTDSISAYTWNNNNSNKYREMVAEAWAEYCNNPHPREIAKTIGETIETEYAKKFGTK